MGDLQLTSVSSLSLIEPSEWNAIANPPGLPYDPFLSWEFLEALESTGTATPATGWTPLHMCIRNAENKLIAAMPLYAKSHSRGEFVFDHSWADAYERAGGMYYPKLLSAVPFTPVTGRRFFIDPSEPDQEGLRNALIAGAIQIAQDNNLSSLHINFLPEADYEQLGELGLLQRTDQQFHFICEPK